MLLSEKRKGDAWILAIEQVALLNTYITLLVLSASDGNQHVVEEGVQPLDIINRLGKELGFPHVRSGQTIGKPVSRALRKLAQYLPEEEASKGKTRYDHILNSDATIGVKRPGQPHELPEAW